MRMKAQARTRWSEDEVGMLKTKGKRAAWISRTKQGERGQEDRRV